jgi:hypothetical protein
MAKQEDRIKIWAKIVAKAWADAGYKKRLLADPASAFAAEGYEIPKSFKLRVVEDKANEATLVLPQPPEEGVQIQDLEQRLAATLWT